MADIITLTYHISPGDFIRAGEISSDVESRLRQMGAPPGAVRKAAVAMYGGEINMVTHVEGGDTTVEISPQCIRMVLADKGPGVPNVDRTVQAGWSMAPDEVRSLGFGAGMGLPNMKKYTDTMKIDTVPRAGTTIEMVVDL